MAYRAASRRQVSSVVRVSGSQAAISRDKQFRFVRRRYVAVQARLDSMELRRRRLRAR